MDKGKISSLQMAILMYPAIVATSIISVPSITAKYAHNDLWLSPIIASLSGFGTLFIVLKLSKLYPNETVFQFSEHIFGRVFGKIVSFFILFFYISSTGQVVRIYSEFIVGNFLFKTPLIVVMASMVLLCAFCVGGGIEVLARAGQIFLPVFILPLVIFIFLLSPDFEMKNLFPFLAGGVMAPIKGAVVPSNWYSEIFLMIFFLPFLSDQQKALKYGIMTVFAVMITLTAVNLTVLFVLGPTTATRDYPLFIASRYVSLAEFFENLESIAMAVWILEAFIKISVFFYASALGTAQWLNLSNYRILIWPLAILILEFGFWTLPSTMDLNRFLMATLPFYGNFIQVLIPLFLLIAAVAKNRKRRGADVS